jgi:hypothetical protein
VDSPNGAQQQFRVRVLANVSCRACPQDRIHAGVVYRGSERNDPQSGISGREASCGFHTIDAARHQKVEHNDVRLLPGGKAFEQFFASI